MPQFIKALNEGMCSMEDIIRANRCRIFLKTMAVVDIATGDGKRISSSYIDGNNILNSTRARDWPNQPRPIERDWISWKLLLKSALCGGVGLGMLTKPLGKWIAG